MIHIKRNSKIALRDINKPDIYMFLYFLNNVSLLFSIVLLSAVYNHYSFLPFGVGIIIFIIGMLYYYKHEKGCFAFLLNINLIICVQWLDILFYYQRNIYSNVVVANIMIK